MSGSNRNGKKGKGGAGAGAHAAARPVATCMAAAIVSVVVLLVAASVLLFLLSPPAPGTPGQGPPREPVELAIGLSGHERWLEALRAWAKLACFNLRLAEPRYHLLRSPASVTKKTLEMSMEMVEHSAESAARATEEALERTTEKVKRKASLSRSPSAQRPDGDL